jgi:pyruvate formate lyase activating enzyme
MIIGGISKTSLIDFPGTIAATIFTVGCPFACHYCHNPELVRPPFIQTIPTQDILNFLATRISKLEGVCITGGEPTIHNDLADFIRTIKNMGFKIKLDTNGINPEHIKELLDEKLLDYIAMDIKGPLANYQSITTKNNLQETILKSIDIIMHADISYEFRTTVAYPLLTPNNFIDISTLIPGAQNYFIQNYVESKRINPTIQLRPFTQEELLQAQAFMNKTVPGTKLRQ